MNIFALSDDPVQAARWHVDRHVVKMPLEAAQMLSTVLYLVGCPGEYKPTHPHHSCTRWAGSTRSNFLWLCDYGSALVAEHKRRYPHTKAGKRGHKAGPIIEWCRSQAHRIQEGPLELFVVVGPPSIKGMGLDPVAAYRRIYRSEKAHLAKWRSPAEKPPWWE